MRLRDLVEASPLGCAPLAAQLTALAGGSTAISLGGGAASFITLPLLRYHALDAAQAGQTPTSGGVVLPMDW